MTNGRSVSPNRKESFTREDVERRHAQAVRFTRDVVGNSDLADEIEDLSADEYAARKGFKLVNPQREEVNGAMATQHQDVSTKLDRMEEAIEQLREAVSSRRTNPCSDDVGAKLEKIGSAVDDIRRGRVSNPGATAESASSARTLRRVAKLRAQREEILDALEEVQDAMDDCKYDEAQGILDEILEDFETEED